MATKDTFITRENHKDIYENKLPADSSIPAESEMGLDSSARWSNINDNASENTSPKPLRISVQDQNRLQLKNFANYFDVTFNLPASINQRISTISHDEETFKQAAHICEEAPKKRIHRGTHQQPKQSQTHPKRNIIWFNTPYRASTWQPT